MGVEPKTEKANKQYRLPLFISVPIAKKIYSDEVLQLMFEGHINHSPAEIRRMVDDIIESGMKLGTATPNLARLRRDIR